MLFDVTIRCRSYHIQQDNNVNPLRNTCVTLFDVDSDELAVALGDTSAVEEVQATLSPPPKIAENAQEQILDAIDITTKILCEFVPTWCKEQIEQRMESLKEFVEDL